MMQSAAARAEGPVKMMQSAAAPAGTEGPVKMMQSAEAAAPARAKEVAARAALHDLGLEIADRWASGFKNRPTQQLILQKIIEPAVRHILNTMFPWIVGMAVLFLVLLICTVITCVIVLRSGPVPLPVSVSGPAVAAVRAFV
jgi:hypothetical protein